MKVIVVGGGIAGPVLSLALSKAGISSAVYERRDRLVGPAGSWLTLQPNGLDALRSIGAARSLEDAGYPVNTIGFVNGRGRWLGRVPMSSPRQDGLASRMLRRADLYEALSKVAEAEGVSIEHGREFVDCEPLEDGRVEARFADGGTVIGDLLVGCDGIHSRVRQIIDPNGARPRYVPLLNVGGYTPNFKVDVPDGEFRMQFGTRCFFAWLPTPDGGTVWFANPPMKREPSASELSGLGDREWRALLHELMDGDVGPAASIVDACPDPLVGWPTYDMPSVSRWQARRMIIIGDAAHAAAPSSGQGASLAAEDAVILAQCLRDRAHVPEALDTFERLRRPRVEKVVRHGARTAASKAAGPVGRLLRDLVLPHLLSRAAADGGRRTTWLQGHHIEFDEPAAA